MPEGSAVPRLARAAHPGHAQAGVGFLERGHAQARQPGNIPRARHGILGDRRRAGKKLDGHDAMVSVVRSSAVIALTV
jgi:hypothetical protein